VRIFSGSSKSRNRSWLYGSDLGRMVYFSPSRCHPHPGTGCGCGGSRGKSLFDMETVAPQKQPCSSMEEETADETRTIEDGPGLSISGLTLIVTAAEIYFHRLLRHTIM
jgi:hypothetical protein